MNNIYISKVVNDEIDKSVSACFSSIIDNNIKANDKVLLKPNFLNDKPANTGVTTDLRIIISLVKLLQKKGIRDISLAEAGFDNTDNIFHNLNIYKLKEYNINIVNLEKENKVLTHYPDAFVLKNMVLPKILFDSNIIISIPTIKTHAITSVSLGLKNLFGFLYKAERRIAHLQDLDKVLIDIYTFINNKLKINIMSLVDGIYCLEGKFGPDIGTPLKLDLIIGGSALINTDYICAQIMDLNPKNIRHLSLCKQFGIINTEQQNIYGEDILSVKKPFEMPFITPTILPQISKLRLNIFKKRPIISNPHDCIQCENCIKACPKYCITLQKNIPAIVYPKCIGCLCCMEGCPRKVFKYTTRNSIIFLLVMKLYKFSRCVIKYFNK